MTNIITIWFRPGFRIPQFERIECDSFRYFDNHFEVTYSNNNIDVYPTLNIDHVTHHYDHITHHYENNSFKSETVNSGNE